MWKKICEEHSFFIEKILQIILPMSNIISNINGAWHTDNFLCNSFIRMHHDFAEKTISRKKKIKICKMIST